MDIANDRLIALGWLALASVFVVILVIQIWAGISLRGLYADGAYYAAQLETRHFFVVIEPSRFTSQILMQAPVVVAMALGFSHPHAVALTFSLATNLMPLLLTMACLGVLPRADRGCGLFPIFIFLATSMSAAVASVADGSTAAAYAWLLLLLILFGEFRTWRLAAILLLAAGALRLHEAMGFLGPIMAFACLWRCRSTIQASARLSLALAAILLTLGCLIAMAAVLHPRLLANRTGLTADILSLRWLACGAGQINVAAVAGGAALLALPLAFLRQRPRAIGMVLVTLLFAVLAVWALLAPSQPASAFAARDNACLLTAPAMLLLLFLRMAPPVTDRLAPMLLVTALLGVAVAAADAKATAGWTIYTKAMRTALASNSGVVPWRYAVGTLPPAEGDALTCFSWPWTTPLMSLWLAPGPIVTTIIANPTGIAWQPADPFRMTGLLAPLRAEVTRDQWIVLLSR